MLHNVTNLVKKIMFGGNDDGSIFEITDELIEASAHQIAESVLEQMSDKSLSKGKACFMHCNHAPLQDEELDALSPKFIEPHEAITKCFSFSKITIVFKNFKNFFSPQNRMSKWFKLIYNNPFFYRKSKFSAKYKMFSIKSTLRTEKAFLSFTS